MSRMQPRKGLENAGGSQHATGKASLPAQVDDDGADPSGKRLEVQRVGAVPEDRQLILGPCMLPFTLGLRATAHRSFQLRETIVHLADGAGHPTPDVGDITAYLTADGG